MKRWLLLTLRHAGGHVRTALDKHHTTTDPICEHYRAPREGSHLDRISRGISCVPCWSVVRHAMTNTNVEHQPPETSP